MKKREALYYCPDFNMFICRSFNPLEIDGFYYGIDYSLSPCPYCVFIGYL